MAKEIVKREKSGSRLPKGRTRLCAFFLALTMLFSMTGNGFVSVSAAGGRSAAKI